MAHTTARTHAHSTHPRTLQTWYGISVKTMRAFPPAAAAAAAASASASPPAAAAADPVDVDACFFLRLLPSYSTCAVARNTTLPWPVSYAAAVSGVTRSSPPAHQAAAAALTPQAKPASAQAHPCGKRFIGRTFLGAWRRQQGMSHAHACTPAGARISLPTSNTVPHGVCKCAHLLGSQGLV
jgi:hypothetical protein